MFDLTDLLRGEPLVDLLDCLLRRCVCAAAHKARAGVALEVEDNLVDLSFAARPFRHGAALPYDFEALLLEDPSEHAGSTRRDVHPHFGHIDAAAIAPHTTSQWWISCGPRRWARAHLSGRSPPFREMLTTLSGLK